MPRLKKNRGVVSRRKRPALPDGDSDTSMTEDERKQKLDNYLQDLDVQVISRIEQMRSQAKLIISSIKGAYRLELMKMPPNMRKMKLCEFYAYGGKIDATVLEGASKAVTAVANAVLQNAPTNNIRPPLEDKTNKSNKTPAQSSRKKKAPRTEVAESPTTGRCLRSTRKRKNVPESPSSKTKSKQQKTENTMPPPTTVGKSTRKNPRINNQFVTPACQQSVRNMPQTPFVTPKFDPSLPVTPAFLREPIAGEWIMSMSGSPLANATTPSHIAQVLVPIGDGKSLQFTAENSPSQVPRLNEQARKNLELLQEQLSRLLHVKQK